MARILGQLVDVYEQEGKHQESIVALKKLRDLDPNSGNSEGSSIRLLTAYLIHGQLKEAEELLQSDAAQTTPPAIALNELGSATQRATQAYFDSGSGNPAEIERVLKWEMQTAKKLSDLQQGDNDSKTFSFNGQLANVLMAEGKYGEAEHYYELVLDERPRSFETQLQSQYLQASLSHNEFLKHELDNAKRLYGSDLSLIASAAEPLQNLALACLKSGDYRRAEEVFQWEFKIIRANPHYRYYPIPYGHFFFCL